MVNLKTHVGIKVDINLNLAGRSPAPLPLVDLFSGADLPDCRDVNPPPFSGAFLTGSG